MTKHELDPWIEGYLAYLTEVRRQACGTVKDVRCTLRRAESSIAIQRPSVPLWQLTLEDYIHWLDRERAQGRSSSSLAKYICHLRGFLDYSWRSGRCDRNVLDGFRLHDGACVEPPLVLTVKEARCLVEACPKGTAQQRRDRMIILLLYGCGLRTRELCALNVQDVNQERRELFVARGKGSRQRYVPIPDGVLTELLAYLLDRRGRRGPLFRTEAKHVRIGARDVSRAVRCAVERAGIDQRVTARTLRHTFATHLMDRGVDLAVISMLMGHRSPSETGVYLHVLPRRPREAVRRLDKEPTEGGR